MLINVLKFFIISKEQFNQIILDMGLYLDEFDNTYMITYIAINVYAIACILGATIMVIILLKTLFRKGGISDILS